MNYLGPSTDFFGPKASKYTDIMGDRPDIHLIPQCGERIVKAIDKLATEIAASKTHPEWQRRDGSIVYDQLPYQIKTLFVAGDFDEKGYINLDRIHIYSLDTLIGLSNSQRRSFKANHCQLPGNKCMKASRYMRSVIACAALTYRLIEGRRFDVRRHTYGKTPIFQVDSHRKIEDSKALIDLTFKPIWGYAEKLKAANESSLVYYLWRVFT